jgi:mannosyltransferase OCH1-like enzyme
MLALCLLCCLFRLSHERTAPFFSHLALLPKNLPPIVQNASYSKQIPRRLWVAVKDRNDPLPGHLKELFERNPLWEVNICDNACKDTFMDGLFFNTSVSAVYNIINPLVGAARADVWRYSVLYVYGGVYLDDDSYIGVPLDEVQCCTNTALSLCWLTVSVAVTIDYIGH